MATEEQSQWWSIPEPLLFKIFCYLPIKDILNAGLTCQDWHIVANDNFLWKKKFCARFKADRRVDLKPGAESWKSEYIRLQNNSPTIIAQRLKGHKREVLHVSFSHNGEMFATCSKDNNVKVWNSNHPCTERYSHDMMKFNWFYPDFSQFNQSDTLLLVSGTILGLGEIAVFTVDGKSKSHLRCRIVNQTFTIRTWFSDPYLISGNFPRSCESLLWLKKAKLEKDLENIPVFKKLYKFNHRNLGDACSPLIARCPWLDESNDQLLAESCVAAKKKKINCIDQIDGATACVSNPHAHPATHSLLESAATSTGASAAAERTLRRSNYYDDNLKSRCSSEYCCEDLDDCEDETINVNEEVHEIENSIPSLLIFTLGSKTAMRHEIGIKRIGNDKFAKKLDPSPSLQQMAQPNNEPQRDYDKIDKKIDLNGHIIGMTLSPDHRYLYVNVRRWPENSTNPNPYCRPIAQDIEINKISLMTFKSEGIMQLSIKAETSMNWNSFLYMDVCDEYISSGAEDFHVYLWDRYYEACFAKFKQPNVVNSAAFNPRDSEMLVTTSNDSTIKVWRSRSKAKELNIGKFKRNLH